MAQLTYLTGRGAWNGEGIGGTLNADGTGAGPYYRAPATGSHMAMPGYVASKVLAAGAPVDVNFYAVYIAVKGIQREIGADEDGLFGPATAARLRTWQAEKRIEADGVFGPDTAAAMFQPLAANIAAATSTSSMIAKLVVAHVTVESQWDPGAVGRSTPHDLGLGQINGDAHPDLSPAFRLAPRHALRAVTQFVHEDCVQMVWVPGDAIAAYNLGVTGARAWVKAGRPEVFHLAPIGAYVAAVKAAMA